MSKVFISRSDGNIPWGFRLQGGMEYNEPLVLTNVSVVSISRKISSILTATHQSIEKGKQLWWR
jgi:hypothetical protein